MQYVDWVVLGGYLLIVVLLGLWFGRRQKNTEEYFVGGRHVPWWAAGLSIFGTSISTGTFIAMPGQAYGGDWTYFFPNLMVIPAALLVAWLVIPFYRRVARLSAYEFLEHRFGYGARVYAGLLTLINGVYWMGTILFLTAKAMHAMTGWHIYWIVIVTGTIAVVYTTVGGLQAVVWTDVLQSITLFGGGLFCIGALLLAADGGELIQTAYEADKFVLPELSLNLMVPSILVMAMFGFLDLTDGRACGQGSVQRYLAVPTTRDAQKSVIFGSLSSLVTWGIFIVIGTLLFSYYRLNPELLPEDIASKETQVFPYFVMSELPAGVTGIILAGICAAMMSSLDTVINMSSLITVVDFYERFRPQSSDRTRLLLGKVSALVYGIMGIGIALWLISSGVEEALKFNMKVFSIMGGGRLGLFILGMFVRRAHAVGVYIGLVVGVCVALWGSLDVVLAGFDVDATTIETVRFPLNTLMVLFCTNAATVFAGWLSSLLIPDHSGRDSAGLTVFDK